MAAATRPSGAPRSARMGGLAQLPDRAHGNWRSTWPQSPDGRSLPSGWRRGRVSMSASDSSEANVCLREYGVILGIFARRRPRIIQFVTRCVRRRTVRVQEHVVGLRVGHARPTRSPSHVFLNSDGTPYAHTVLRNRMIRWDRQAKIPDITPYALRHTFASLESDAHIEKRPRWPG